VSPEDDLDADDEPGYSLVMPFVTCGDGGAHDDASYVAGFEAGTFNARLEVAASLGVAETQWALAHTTNLPQIDLIAMRHGFTVVREDFEGEWPDYTQVRFVRPLTPGADL
jgi:hypothetical protein